MSILCSSVKLNVPYHYFLHSWDVLTDTNKEPYRNYTDESYSISCNIVLRNYESVHIGSSKVNPSLEVPIVYITPFRTIVN